MLRKIRFVPVLALLAALVGSSPSIAQFATGGAAAPGQRVSADALRKSGGEAGAALAGHVGVRPVLAVWWRPGDALSERALRGAHRAWEDSGRKAAFFPVAIIAAGQSTKAVSLRLAELGMRDVPHRTDTGSLALAVGVRRVPSFALIDVTGVLRAVGGSDIGQSAPNGITLLEAFLRASRGEPVATLGVLPARPTYQMLGRDVPQIDVTEQDGTTWRSIRDFLEPGKKTLLFYWRPSCSHCREALPKLKAWYDETRPKDVVVIDIARADSLKARNQAIELVKDAGWTHLLDVQNIVARRLLVTETPTSFLIDEKGEVLSVQVGGEVDWAAWVQGSRRASRR